MQCVLDLSSQSPNPKRRKALQACDRCRKSKKGCMLSAGSRQCQRCVRDSRRCSFAEGEALISPVSLGHPEFATNGVYRGPHDQIPGAQELADGVFEEAPAGTDSWRDSTGSRSLGAIETPSSIAMGPRTRTSNTPACTGGSKELRYATMLQILSSNDGSSNAKSQNTGVKLISGTNPLSALLQKELKHKIVTNSCSFRTPDPATSLTPRALRGIGTGVYNYDWEQFYINCGTPPVRVQYLRAIGCFELPSQSTCSHHLEVYFTRVHPLLPVIDKKEFLAAYYGSESPPSLVVLRAVFLAASRYSGGEEVRSHCDDMHSKLRALIEAGLSTERLSVVQATVIASLHWEGREGVNSAIDNLSLAVRLCQEMGLHRKATVVQGSSQPVMRRIWWVLYALDRLNAAQEGTPFLINERDCDAEPLNEDDFRDEDQLTRKTTLLNTSMALLVEDAVRKLYAPGEDHTTLFTPRGVLIRQDMERSLESLAQDIVYGLIQERNAETAFQNAEQDPSAFWCAILLTHLDAVRILIHRPFLLYADAHEQAHYSSRDASRCHAHEIVSRLQTLRISNTLRYSWPFTVYALVNCLLIFWYDVSSPGGGDPQSRRAYTVVVDLLREMGSTWWAAAAKHRLAVALGVAADEIKAREGKSAVRPTSETHGYDGDTRNISPVGVDSHTTGEAEIDASIGDSLFLYRDDGNMDFWASIGLNFESEVASGIYGIF